MNSVGTQLLNTDRLVLRQFNEKDIDDVYKNYGSDPKVNRFISFAPCQSIASTRDFILMHLEQYKINPAFYGWAIALDDEVIGSIGLFNVDKDAEQCELGYSIGSKWWGKGYATEAAEKILEYGFNHIGVHRIYASHHIDNIASGNVLKKIGMQEEGILRDGQHNSDGSFSDLKLYAKLVSDK